MALPVGLTFAVISRTFPVSSEVLCHHGTSYLGQPSGVRPVFIVALTDATHIYIWRMG
jgi:hypothetical protein